MKINYIRETISAKQIYFLSLNQAMCSVQSSTKWGLQRDCENKRTSEALYDYSQLLVIFTL